VKLRAAVIGCGLIGKRRATEAARHAGSTLVAVADTDDALIGALAREFGCRGTERWQDVVSDSDVDVVVVSTPNAFLAEISIAALEAGKHVLLEKPMGRTLEEARAIAAAAEKSGKRVKIGFNHRYHPALRRAHALFAGGEIGKLINLRVRYGHGGRPGYEREWRGNPELAGGGELTDQGVHALDLIHWFAGLPSAVAALTQTAVWPIAPLEDNGFALLAFESGTVAALHTSWTQWKNLFSFEVFGERGALIVEGLGRSYGVETLHIQRRALAGAAPETRIEEFEGPDESWKTEWAEFTRAILGGAEYQGGPADGLAVMAMLEALYRSALSKSFSLLR
jgi:predicted dehydrogenase